MKVRSLFWTIFITIVSVNLALIVANAYWLGVQLEKRNVKARFSEKLDEHLVRLIDEYEENKSGRYHHRENRIPGKLIRQFHLEIIDLSNGRPLWPAPRPMGEIGKREDKQITSSTGRKYRVIYLDDPELSSPFWEILSRFGTVRWFITILFSIAGSYVLSLIIISPLKKLIRHTQNLANGDLSTRVEARLEQREDEIGTLSQSFNDMAERIQGLIEGQQTLLHDVSHELRAPLQRLQVNIELARDKYAPDDSNAAVFDRQQREIDKLHQMINDILELARVRHQDKASIPSTSKELDIIHVENEIKEIMTFYAGQNPQKQIHYSSNLEAEPIIHGNQSFFDRVLNNIIENAMKHTPATAQVFIDLQSNAKSLRIIVSDDGEGVDASMLDQLTQPFFRGKPDQQTQGNGLGLSIASKAMEAMRGSLEVKRSTHGGLEVSITFSR